MPPRKSKKIQNQVVETKIETFVEKANQKQEESSSEEDEVNVYIKSLKRTPLPLPPVEPPVEPLPLPPVEPKPKVRAPRVKSALPNRDEEIFKLLEDYRSELKSLKVQTQRPQGETQPVVVIEPPVGQLEKPKKAAFQLKF